MSDFKQASQSSPVDPFHLLARLWHQKAGTLNFLIPIEIWHGLRSGIILLVCKLSLREKEDGMAELCAVVW